MVTAGAHQSQRARRSRTSPCKLEIDGRLVDTRTVTLEPNAAGVRDVPARSPSRTPMRATVRAGTDALPEGQRVQLRAVARAGPCRC